MFRQTGKSTLIAEAMKKDKKSVCIQPTEMMKQLFCKNFKINPTRVYTMHEAIKKLKDKKCNIYIDEIGACIGNLFKRNIILATHTNQSMEWYSLHFSDKIYLEKYLADTHKQMLSRGFM